jgi:hypothetical protein
MSDAEKRDRERRRRILRGDAKPQTDDTKRWRRIAGLPIEESETEQ